MKRAEYRKTAKRKIARQINAICEHLELTRDEFAGKLGITVQPVYKWMRGHTEPYPRTAGLIEASFNAVEDGACDYIVELCLTGVRDLGELQKHIPACPYCRSRFAVEKTAT